MSQQIDLTEDTLRGGAFRPVHAGDSYNLKYTITRDGLALDITGATAWFTVKESETELDSDAKLQLISSNSAEIEITDPINGKLMVKFKGTGAAQKNTSDIAGLWDYDLQVLVGTEVITVAYGKIEFLRNLTRATT